jgi:hypothetical protein
VQAPSQTARGCVSASLQQALGRAGSHSRVASCASAAGQVLSSRKKGLAVKRLNQCDALRSVIESKKLGIDRAMLLHHESKNGH